MDKMEEIREKYYGFITKNIGFMYFLTILTIFSIVVLGTGEKLNDSIGVYVLIIINLIIFAITSFTKSIYMQLFIVDNNVEVINKLFALNGLEFICIILLFTKMRTDVNLDNYPRNYHTVYIFYVIGIAFICFLVIFNVRLYFEKFMLLMGKMIKRAEDENDEEKRVNLTN